MSEIVSATIDADFPVAGQDNDSQGFRDNFRIIKDGLATANSEISILEQKTVKTETFDGQPVVNDFFAKSKLVNAITNRLQGLVYTSTVSGSATIDYEVGEYQKFTVEGNSELTFLNWPEPVNPSEQTYARLKIELVGGPSAYEVRFLSTGGDNIQFLNGGSTSILTEVNKSILIDAWTVDGGTSTYLQVVGYTEPTLTIGSLDNINDVTINTGSLADGDVLKWSAGGEVWVSGPVTYGDLSGTPSLAAVATTGAYGDLSGRPTLATVATSGAYGDLSGRPTLATVATSGAYGDLSGAPTIPEDVSDLTDTGNLLAADEADWKGSANLPDGSAASLSVTANYFSTATAETATLAAGTEGQIKVFSMAAASGNMVITVANPGWGGAGTITFSATGQGCTLQYFYNKWFCIGNNGAVFA